jgi:murein DD-endopeptidase MepM/ murein hydrolase activator NlpD
MRYLPCTRRQFAGAIGAALLGDRVRAQEAGPALRVSAVDTFTVAPTGDGRMLVGELLLQAPPGTAIDIVEVRLRSGVGDGVRRITGAEITERLGERRTGAALPSPRVAAGGTAILFLWEAHEDAAPFTAVELDEVPAGFPAGAPRRTTAVPIAASAAPPRLGPPLRGGPWVALYDPWMPRGHRRASFDIGGRLVIPARFAIDFVRLDPQGGLGGPDFSGWFGFGEDVLAVADGRVAAARDGRPDVLTPTRPANPTDDDVSGNYVLLALSGGGVACCEHLQRGSLRVAAGDEVRRGQVLARLGRSGVNSTGPHLHFHVSDTASTLDAQGRPYALEAFDVLGRYPDVAEALRGTRWPAGAAPGRAAVLPATNAVLRFPTA